MGADPSNSDVLGRSIGSCLFVLGLLSACLPEGVEHEAEYPLAQQPAPPAPTSKLVSLESVEASSTKPEAEPRLEPEPRPPEPAPFAGRERVRVDELLSVLSGEVAGVAASQALRDDYALFVERFELHDRGLDLEGELFLDYVRVKIAFESTRAGGLWGLAWDITNEQPNSEKIWAAWQHLDADPVPETLEQLALASARLGEITAIAECDELSALFAFVAHRIGLSKSSEVGLFWPTGNHVVAVWTIDPKAEKPVRVVVPTSQIFLDGAQSLGTEGFNPWTQKRIFNYRRQDAPATLELPAILAAHFIVRVREQAGRSQAQLQAQRNAKESRQVQTGF